MRYRRFMTKRQRRGGLTNDQMHMLSVAGGYDRKTREVLAKRMGAKSCRHVKRKASSSSPSVPAGDASGLATQSTVSQ